MFRLRCVLFCLALGLVGLSGCTQTCERPGLFSRFRTTSWTRDCECESAMPAPTGDTPILVPPGDTPPFAPPPRIIPIPHATPTPYTPPPK